MLIENVQNKRVGDIYSKMLLSEVLVESKNNKAIKIIDKWEKKHINHSEDKNKVKKSLAALKKIVNSDEDSILMLDKVSAEIANIKKYIDDAMADELTELIGVL